MTLSICVLGKMPTYPASNDEGEKGVSEMLLIQLTRVKLKVPLMSLQ